MAFSKKKNRIVCNMCIYKDDDLAQMSSAESQDDLLFISDVAADLKKSFDQKFVSYKTHLNELHKVAPRQVINNFEFSITNFFNKITNHINDIEAQYLSRVDNCQNLKQLTDLLKTNENSFGRDLSTRARFEEEVRLLEKEVRGGLYA